jgi:MoaA/NifB/PqqE/SkfB family radical SAM enzyme
MWVESQKYHLHIELTSKCNSACPNCPRFVMGSTKLNPSVTLSELKLNDIKKWFNYDFIQKIGSINFCGNLGDPTNCIEMNEIVEYFYVNNENIKIEIHTNGGARNVDFWKKLGKLSKKAKDNILVIFSVDGLEETNHIYRRNVKWEKLVENITTYTKNGGYAIWEFLLFGHNEDEIYLAKYKSKEYGFRSIRFKRAAGFEDYLNNRTIPMGVYDKEGTLEYLIEPSKDYPNSTMVYDGNPKIIPEKVNLDIYNFKYNGLDYKEYSTFKDYKIKCKSLKPNGEIEIFLSYRGEIRPCCFIGVDLDKHSLGGYNTQLKEIFNYDCNLNTNSLDNILDFFDKKVKDKWDDTFENGKCIKCSMMCGASSQIDHSRLYENIEI